MKVEVKEGEKRYPYIGESDGAIVIFTACEEGVLLVAGDTGWNVGYSSLKWRESDFTPFTGSVTLSN